MSLYQIEQSIEKYWNIAKQAKINSDADLIRRAFIQINRFSTMYKNRTGQIYGDTN